jgi:hypothetical protein
MKVYEWSQNNSGGVFDTDDQLCHRVVIEAETLDEAEEKAFSLGIYYDGVERGYDCDCCGDRWVRPWVGDEDFDDKESLFDFYQKKTNQYGWTKPDARIFFKDGEVKEIFTQR